MVTTAPVCLTIPLIPPTVGTMTSADVTQAAPESMDPGSWRARTASRRDVLRWAGVGGLAAAGLAGLTGCSQAQGPVQLPVEAAKGTPARGGRLRMARPANSRAETLDSAASLSAYEYLGALYNRLVRLDEAGNPVPDLAAEWDVTPDARRWTFRMRDGVHFHDGRPFTSRDAAFTLAHILDPAVGSPQAGVLTSVMTAESISAPDPTTLVVDLTAPHSDLPSLLTAYQCYVVPDGSTTEQINTSGIGTGPFRLSHFRPGGRGSVEAFDDHFAGRPVLDGIDFYSIQDTQARVNALMADQIDLISQTNLDFATAQVVAASSAATIARVTNGQWYTIPLLGTSGSSEMCACGRRSSWRTTRNRSSTSPCRGPGPSATTTQWFRPMRLIWRSRTRAIPSAHERCSPRPGIATDSGSNSPHRHSTRCSHPWRCPSPMPSGTPASRRAFATSPRTRTTPRFG